MPSGRRLWGSRGSRQCALHGGTLPRCGRAQSVISSALRSGARMDDVIIIGAGLAGLMTARRLEERGASVRVIEARDRVGGRTLSHRSASGKIVDLGAQWIGPTQDRVAALVQEMGLHTFDQYCTGKKILELGDKKRTYKADIPSLPLLGLLDLGRALKKLDALCAKVPLETPEKAKKADLWDRMTVE